MKNILLIFCLLLACGCVRSDHYFELLDLSFAPETKSLVIENKSQGISKTSEYTSKLRVALAKKDFTLLKYDSKKKVTQEFRAKSGNDLKIREQFSKMESQYLLTISAVSSGRNNNKKYPCAFSDIEEVRTSIDLTDVSTNTVVAVIVANGLTDICESRDLGVYDKTVFDEIANAIDEIWYQPELAKNYKEMVYKKNLADKQTKTSESKSDFISNKNSHYPKSTAQKSNKNTSDDKIGDDNYDPDSIFIDDDINNIFI